MCFSWTVHSMCPLLWIVLLDFALIVLLSFCGVYLCCYLLLSTSHRCRCGGMLWNTIPSMWFARKKFWCVNRGQFWIMNPVLSSSVKIVTDKWSLKMYVREAPFLQSKLLYIVLHTVKFRTTPIVNTMAGQYTLKSMTFPLPWPRGKVSASSEVDLGITPLWNRQ